MKECMDCKEVKSLDDYSIVKATGKPLPRCKPCQTVHRRDYFSAPKYRLTRLKKRALKKGFECNLTEQDINELLLSNTHCPVLGIKLELGGGSEERYNCPSIDRIDNEVGYVRGNVQLISHRANAMKQDASPEELVAFAKWVLNNYQSDD